MYIGDKINKDGIKSVESKIETILNLPSPQNKKDVERLLGVVTYLSSRKFKQFADSWEFKHTTTSPTHPRANGQVEKAMGATKYVLKKANEDDNEPYIALLENRNTPIT